ncbi:hypothetical protein ACIRBY_37135 [Streptomyces sp. NPDC096136]|uniref:hypothetical protein n=1 Tax=Streptomyces sp. NPDC096136 TaxID=3366076 RepID=UPI00380A3728
MPGSSAAAAITAREVPELRADLVAWLGDPSPRGARGRPLMKLGQAQWGHGFVDTLHTSLRAAELYYVNADMARFAVAASTQLPSFRLTREELPSPHGLVVWEQPITDPPFPIDVPCWGAMWTTGRGGVGVSILAERDAHMRFLAAADPVQGHRELTTAEKAVLRRLDPPTDLVLAGFTNMPFTEAPQWLPDAPLPTGLTPGELSREIESRTFLDQVERTLVATWLLMGQTLTRDEPVTTPKSAAKRIARMDPSLLTSTRYCTLRHQSTAPSERSDGDVLSLSYRHRWIVRGHWRNHAYGTGQALRRRIWISPHLKGPDGAPLTDPSKLVNILRR